MLRSKVTGFLQIIQCLHCQNQMMGLPMWCEPNIGWERFPEQAANTNPELVARVVDLCFEAGASDVLVTDASCNDPNRSFQKSGIGLMAYNAGARVVLPQRHRFREMALDGGILRDWLVYQPLIQADKVFRQLEEWGRRRDAARVVLSMVDRRIKYAAAGKPDVLAHLISEIRRVGHPLLESFISYSPKIASLETSLDGRILPVLIGAPNSLVHVQLHHIAHDVVKLLDQTGLAAS